MEIRYIYINRNGDVICQDQSFMTYQTTLRHNADAKIVLLVMTDTGARFVNLSRLASLNREVFTAATWANLETLLTNEMVTSYAGNTPPASYCLTREGDIVKEIPIPKYTSFMHHPIIISCEHSDKIDLDYGTINDPSLRNLTSLRWMLTDIIVKHRPGQSSVDFNNVIPIVNGMTCMPVVYNNELYIRQGARYLASSTAGYKGILLVDLSQIGTLEIIPLADCTISASTGMIDLPVSVDTTGKVPVLVAANRMFYTPDVAAIARRRIRFDANSQDLEKILLNTMLITRTFIPNTGTVTFTDETVLNEILTNTDGYVILISNPNTAFVRHRPYWNITVDQIMFPAGAEGLLVRSATKEIVDYVRAPYNSTTAVSLPPPHRMEHLAVDDTKYPGKEIAYQRTNAPSFYPGENVDVHGHYLLDIYA